MNSEDKLYLKKMIDANNVKDQTKNIQKLKHSSKIIKDIETVRQKTNLFSNKKIENKWNEFIKNFLSFEL